MMRRAAPLLLLALTTAPAIAEACDWSEPRRTYAEGMAWHCVAFRWADGDTLTAACHGQAQPVRVRLRGVDTVERGDPTWSAARAELQRRTQGQPIEVLPRHRNRNRVVADVMAAGDNVGLAMDADGWSKAVCPRR